MTVLLAQSLTAEEIKPKGQEGAGKPTFSIYGEGGATLTSYRSMDMTYNPGFSTLASFHVGAGVNARFFKRNQVSVKDGLLGIQAGVLYTQGGFVSGQQTVKGNYLCIPVCFQLYPVKNLFLETGPEACLNLGLTPEQFIVGDDNLDLRGLRANDLKLAVGAGYILDTIPLGISVKYLIGTNNFAKNLHWKSNQLRISVFYRFK